MGRLEKKERRDVILLCNRGMDDVDTSIYLEQSSTDGTDPIAAYEVCATAIEQLCSNSNAAAADEWSSIGIGIGWSNGCRRMCTVR